MINKKYLFTRTDRIGDFIVSAILLKSIKRSDKNSIITVIASQKNYNYIKKFSYVDEVIKYPTSLVDKLSLYINFFFKKYDLVAALDGKKRSIFLCIITNSKIKILCTYKKFYKNILKLFFSQIYLDEESISRIDEIKSILNSLNYILNDSDLDTISKKEFNSSIVNNNDYILLHFDEKWIHNDYIKNYKSIEPDNYLEFENFIKSIVSQTENNLYITTGLISNKFISIIKNKFNKSNEFIFELKHNNKKIIFFEKTTFFELEVLISKSSMLISCHGAPTHVASAFNIKIIDILDKSKLPFYEKWTRHLRNYKKVERDNFRSLSDKIINIL